MEYKIRAFMFSKILCQTFYILRRIHRGLIIHARRYSRKYSSFLSHLNQTLILSTEFRDCFEYST
jgi:hypothetical protein